MNATTAPKTSPRAAPGPQISPGERDAELAHELRLACMRVSRRVRFEATQEVAPHQFSVLARLDEGQTSLGELAARERVRAPSMSRTVAALVDLGMVERSADPNDGRIVWLTLTEPGRSMLAQERGRRDAWMAVRLMNLSEQEKATLRAATALLERVVSE